MMWPFAKREIPAARMGPSLQELSRANIAELRAWRKIGEKFTYLGRDMVVTGHWKDFHGPMYFRREPLLVADYVDNTGVIHSVGFSMQEARALIAGQP